MEGGWFSRKKVGHETGINIIVKYPFLGYYYRMDIKRVILSKKAENNLWKVPKHIVVKLNSWIESVSVNGLNYTRKIPGYHDEPLKGDRKGQRSIRLSKSYRAIYVIDENDKIEFVEVREVNKHEY